MRTLIRVKGGRPPQLYIYYRPTRDTNMWANVFNYFCRTMGAYKRKTQQQAWDVDNMQRAIQAVRNNVMGLKRAANEFGVPRSTLQRRCRRNGDDATAAEKVLGRFRPVFSQELELQLVNHIKRMEGMLFRFTLAPLRRLAFDFADANGLDHPFNRENRPINCSEGDK